MFSTDLAPLLLVLSGVFKGSRARQVETMMPQSCKIKKNIITNYKKHHYVSNKIS